MAPTSAYAHTPSTRLRPAKPALKLTPIHPAHIQLPPMDLTALVAASIRAHPSPRRNQPDFRFSGGAEAAPVAPPPTPVDDSFLHPHSPTSATSTPRSEKRVHWEPWPSDGIGESPRSSGEKERDA